MDEAGKEIFCFWGGIEYRWGSGDNNSKELCYTAVCVICMYAIGGYGIVSSNEGDVHALVVVFFFFFFTLLLLLFLHIDSLTMALFIHVSEESMDNDMLMHACMYMYPTVYRGICTP